MGALGGDDDVAATQQRGVAGEAVAVVDPDQRHQARQLGPEPEGQAVEPGDVHAVGVARAPAAALGEEHHREPEPLRQLEQAVLLAMVLAALGSGEDRVVVGHDGAPGRVGTEAIAVDAADAGHQAVGRGVGDEVLDAAAAALRRDDERAVLDVGAVVDEVGDVLACGALPGPAPLGDGVGAAMVRADLVALDGLGEVGSDVIGIDGVDCAGDPCVDHAEASMDDQRMAFEDRLAGLDVDGHDDTAHVGGDACVPSSSPP